jgi:ABC-type transport system involved in cytochrome bd biosynthesis fused ATPase/permease subunit
VPKEAARVNPDRDREAWTAGRRKQSRMTQTKFTIAALIVGFTIAALIVFSAVTMGAVAGS